MAKIFISYAREDYEDAKRIYDYLLKQGQQPWIDKEKILPGQKWQPAIKKAIRSSQFFIALLSPNSVEKRGYVQKELRFGVEVLDEIPDSQIFFIPVRLTDCEPDYDRLKELQWVDMFPDWDKGLERLMRVFSFIPDRLLGQDLTSSKWRIEKNKNVSETIVVFEKKGVLKRWKGKDPKKDGNWKQNGNVVYLEVNQKFAQYKGIIENDQMSGQAQNIRGVEWVWKAEKIVDV